MEMKYLAELLTKNPLIVVSMFVFTLLSTLAGLLVSWEDLYRDYLSKSISIPAWLLLLLIVIGFFGWIVYGTRKKNRNDAPLELIADKSYGVQRVSACGKKFVNCKFSGTEIVIDGQAGLGFENCNFESQRFTFDGYASLTISILAGMYRDPSFRPMVDHAITNIKTGNFLMATPPST
jgi:hypothetical protein